MDYNAGSDSNTGSITSPFKTLLKGVLTARAQGGVNTIVMRNGTHFINETIQFTPQDSYLTIQVCYFDEERNFVMIATRDLESD